MTKGERIKARREELGITQVALADMIGESKQTVYKYESGLVSNIPSDKVELIAKALGVLRHGGPAVFENFNLAAALRDHGLDRDRHAR